MHMSRIRVYELRATPAGWQCGKRLRRRINWWRVLGLALALSPWLILLAALALIRLVLP